MSKFKSRVVKVTVPSAIANDLGKFQDLQKKILGELGCMACCSGFDIRYRFRDRFAVDIKGQFTQF
jgi:hypothetical protein